MKHHIKTALPILLFVVLCLPCTGISDPPLTDPQKKDIVYKMYDDYKREFPSVNDISPGDAMNAMAGGRVIFVDTRKPAEMKVSMLPGSVKKDIFVRDHSKYQGYRIIAYCTISYRSGLFSAEMAKKGVRIENLRGGLLAWLFEGGSVYDASGETKRVHVYGKKWNYLPKGYEPVFFGFFEKYFNMNF